MDSIPVFYSLQVKDNGPGIDLIITRAMLAIAAVACFVYRSNDHAFLNISAALLLVLAALLVKTLVVKYGIHKTLVLTIASIVLFIATGSVAFALILLVYGVLVKYIFRKNDITVSREGVSMKKTLTPSTYPWPEFNNVILKDSLLTIDFKNNKLLQVYIDEKNNKIDEQEFNKFCNSLLVQPG